MRNEEDLECLACPPKYRAMQDFYKCVSDSGAAVLPFPSSAVRVVAHSVVTPAYRSALPSTPPSYPLACLLS